MARVRVGKKAGKTGRGILGIWQRELGDLSPKNFKNRFAASEDLLYRLGIHRKLNQHRGCVNTISFNEDGNILVSGSDDRMVILWDWDVGKVKLSFHSGHSNNVFQARFMPFTNDQTIVTCAADGEVRHAHIREGGEVATSILAQHGGPAHKLAIEPGSPHIFYSCGEDSLVQHFDLRTKSATELFKCKSFQDKSTYIPIVPLNAISIDPRNPNYFAVAGTDSYAQLYDIRKYTLDGSVEFGQPCDCFCPPHLIDDEVSITGLAFSNESELLVSYSHEFIYLFPKDQGLGPEPSRSIDDDYYPKIYKEHRNCDTVKGVNFYGPNCEYVISGSDCGRIFMWRKTDGELLRVMEGDIDVVNCIEPHPYSTTIASSGIESDVKIWTPNATERAPPVNMDELKKHKRAAFCQYAFPEQLIAQILLTQQIQRGESSTNRAPELMDFLMTRVDDDDSNDSNGHDGLSDDETPGDCIVS